MNRFVWHNYAKRRIPLRTIGVTVAGRMENLKPWPKGTSGNPGGRPRRKLLTELYEELLNDPEFLSKVRAAVTESVSKGQMAMVLQLKEMADRVEGKVSQPINANVNMGLSERLEAARRRITEA